MDACPRARSSNVRSNNQPLFRMIRASGGLSRSGADAAIALVDHAPRESNSPRCRSPTPTRACWCVISASASARRSASALDHQRVVVVVVLLESFDQRSMPQASSKRRMRQYNLGFNAIRRGATKPPMCKMGNCCWIFACCWRSVCNVPITRLRESSSLNFDIFLRRYSPERSPITARASRKLLHSRSVRRSFWPSSNKFLGPRAPTPFS